MHRRGWWVVLGALGGGALAAVIAWTLAGDDVNKEGDWRNGAARFIGSITALGVMSGFLVARQLAGKVPVTRDGFTLSYGRIDPKPDGYREMTTTRVGQLLDRLRAVGYEPTTERCDDTGAPITSTNNTTTFDPETPLAGANFAIRDRGVRGWVRLQLSQPIEGKPRSLGVLEMWSQRGDSTEELGMFVLRSLDGLLDNVAAARESSRLSEDAASLLTAGLAERPQHRKV